MSDIIILPVLAKFYKRADFSDDFNCPIAKAAKAHFGTRTVSEQIDWLKVKHKKYSHEYYGTDYYYKHKDLASAAGYNDTIIFNLELKEVV